MTSSILDRLKYFESIREQQEKVLWAVLSVLGRPDGLLFVGCGDGYVIRSAATMVIRPAIGVENDNEVIQCSTINNTHVLCRSFDKPFHVNGNFELVICLRISSEVLDLETLGDNLIKHTKKWLVCEEPVPDIIREGLIFHEEFSAQLACATGLQIGVYSKL